jgi:hypothetical protein
MRRLEHWGREHAEVIFALIAVIFVAGTAVHYLRYPTQRIVQVVENPLIIPGGISPGGISPGGIGDGQPQGAVGGILVGPPTGVSVAAYEVQRRDALVAAATEAPGALAAAVVSFDAYLHPARIEAALDGSGVRVLAARYRLPARAAARGRATAPRGVVAALVPVLVEEAARAREQAAELETLAETAGDPEFAQQFLADRDELLAAASTVGDDGCACVYAVEVEGRLDVLLALTRAPDVRLVDSAPAGVRADAVRFVALLPEETERTGVQPGG